MRFEVSPRRQEVCTRRSTFIFFAKASEGLSAVSAGAKTVCKKKKTNEKQEERGRGKGWGYMFGLSDPIIFDLHS